MSCVYGFVSCLRSRREIQEQRQRQIQGHNRVPLLPASALDVPEGVVNPTSGALDGDSPRASSLEQQQSDELFSRQGDAQAGSALPVNPEPSAPPAPPVVAQAAPAAPVISVEPATSGQGQGQGQESGSQEGLSTRRSKLPLAPSPLSRVKGFKGTQEAQKAGVYAPPGTTRPGTPVYRTQQQISEQGSRSSEFDTLMGMPFAGVSSVAEVAPVVEVASV